MTIEQLNTFLVVARCQNMSIASEKLFLSQPSVTARIKALEKEMNVVLIERAGRGIKLTDEGRRFIPYAKKMLRMYSKARAVFSNETEKEEKNKSGH